jgi:hypothetical protein
MKARFKVQAVKCQDIFTGADSLESLGEIDGTKRAVLQWVRFGGVIPTHMGELFKHGNGYIYYTTIGRVYTFTR